MAMKPNQMAIIKAVSFKLDPETVVIVANLYHTEKDANGKRLGSKSEYRYEGRIIKTDDLKAEIAQMEANGDQPWKWPTLPDWNILYCFQDINSRGAKWLSDKLKKAKTIDIGMKILAGGKRKHDGSYEIHDGAKYDITGYTADDGSVFDITPEALAKLGPGHTFSKKVILKRKV